MSDPSVPVVDLAAVAADLHGVDRALARLDDGSYGICQVCGEALADEVLAADPTVTVCGAHLPGTAAASPPEG